MKKIALLLLVIGIIPSCIQGRRVKDVDFPATPINLAKITKVGKACFSINAFATRGSGSIIQAAKNGGLSIIYMVEYSEEFEFGGFIQKDCTTVYGE